MASLYSPQRRKQSADLAAETFTALRRYATPAIQYSYFLVLLLSLAMLWRLGGKNAHTAQPLGATWLKALSNCCWSTHWDARECLGKRVSIQPLWTPLTSRMLCRLPKVSWRGCKGTSIILKPPSLSSTSWSLQWVAPLLGPTPYSLKCL